MSTLPTGTDDTVEDNGIHLNSFHAQILQTT